MSRSTGRNTRSPGAAPGPPSGSCAYTLAMYRPNGGAVRASTRNRATSWMIPCADIRSAPAPRARSRGRSRRARPARDRPRPAIRGTRRSCRHLHGAVARVAADVDVALDGIDLVGADDPVAQADVADGEGEEGK